MLDKKTLVRALANRSGVDSATVSKVLEAFMFETVERVRGGEGIRLRGFGTFHRKHCAQRSAAIIKTGERILVPAHDKLAFSPAKRLREV